MSSIVRVAADTDGLGKVFEAYDRFAKTHEVPDHIRRDVYVALEEIVSNVFRHGGAGKTNMSVKLGIAKGAFTVDIVDDGPPFDPFASAPVPDINVPLMDRPIGGLGVLFVNQLTDAHTYLRRRNQNRVSLRRALQR